jgi:hypothetical protein
VQRNRGLQDGTLEWTEQDGTPSTPVDNCSFFALGKINTGRDVTIISLSLPHVYLDIKIIINTL